jgi:hypothetical protein
LDLNGKTLTAQYGYGLLSSGNTPTITMSSGTIKLTGDNTSISAYTYVWDTTDNTTFVGSGTISCNSVLPKYIGPAGRTLPTVEQAGVGTLTLADDGTGTGYVLADLTLKSTVTLPTIIQLQQGVTFTFTNFSLSGTLGAQVTLRSAGAGVQATISKASGTVSVSYLTIQDSAATGGATWNAFTTNGNVDGGNNTGWNFTAPAGSYTITALNGSYTVSGQTATVSRSRSLDASSGSYSVTGQSIDVSFGRLLSAQNGVYSVAGQVVDISVGIPPTPITATDLLIELRSFTERRRF